MFNISKIKLLSLSTFILIITAIFWLMHALFPFDNSHGDPSSFITNAINRFGHRERTQIGEHEDIDLVIRYLDPKGYLRTVKRANASFIKVHIDSFDLLPGDYVTISDPLHQQEYTYPGVSEFTTDAGPGFWALTIFGDTVEIELQTRYSEVELRNLDIRSYGISIDKFARGKSRSKVQDFSYLPESVCGSDERLDAACYQDSHPEEFVKSNAVAMQVFNGLGWCSAWRVGPGDHMFTNEHCITSQAELNASEFWFGHQRLACGRGAAQIPTIVTGKTLLADDYLRDFALFTVNDAYKIMDFGWLEIDDRAPSLGEEIYIPQQPGGLFPDDQRKVIALNSDMNSGNACRIEAVTVDGRWRNTDTSYMCDTSPGASGSPVLVRSSHAAISLHHVGGCSNQGVRMNQIWPMVEEHLFPFPEIVSVSTPEKVEVGEPFSVTIEAQNNNAVSPEGIINVSVLYSDGSSDLLISKLDASWADQLNRFEPGQGTLLDKECREISNGVSDHVIDAVDTSWEPGERHTMAFSITPHQEGTLWLRIRNTMKDVRTGCHYSNTATISSGQGVSDVDQNGWEVFRLEIDVEPQTQVGSLVLDGYSIDDDTEGGSYGNGDGVLNCGEMVELGINLRNSGNTLVDGINVVGIVSEPLINIKENFGEFSEIPPGETRSEAALIEISSRTPDDSIAVINLDITAPNTRLINDSLELPVACVVKTIPVSPYIPYPANGSEGVSINSQLSWDFESIYIQEPVTYDVYLYEDKSASKSLKCLDTLETFCSPGLLKQDAQYTWYVIATDSDGLTIRSTDWSFMTGGRSEAPGLYLPLVFSDR